MERTIIAMNLEHYMNEAFIHNAFRLSGVEPLKVHASGNNNEGLHECHVELKGINECHEVVRTLNDKIIPHSTPPVRFKITYAYYGKADSAGRRPSSSTATSNPSGPTNRLDENSLFVSNLSDDVTTDLLYAKFSAKYQIVSAKVIYHNDGRSKGCGFVRFFSDYEMQKALVEMQHMTGLGKNPIRIRLAYKFPPPKKDADGTSYSSNANAYYSYQNYWAQPKPEYEEFYPYGAYQYPQDTQQADTQYQQWTTMYDDDTLEEPNTEDDVEQMNKVVMERTEELYTLLEESRWLNLEKISHTSSGITT